jgi:hypothetical protein
MLIGAVSIVETGPNTGVFGCRVGAGTAAGRIGGAGARLFIILVRGARAREVLVVLLEFFTIA